MRLDIIGNGETGWELMVSVGVHYEPICVAEKMSYGEAVDVFVANHPEYMEELDRLKAEWFDFMGGEIVARKGVQQRKVGPKREKKRGSGARFRELILQGKTNEECLRVVRAEFPESKATLSDAAYQRSALKKNPSAYSADGQKV